MSTTPSLEAIDPMQIPICCGYDVPVQPFTEEQQKYADRIQRMLAGKESWGTSLIERSALGMSK